MRGVQGDWNEETGAYQVFHPLEKLLEEGASLIFAQLLLHHDVVEQLALGGQLKDEIDAVVLVKGVFETENVGVADTHEDANLLLQTLRLGRILDSSGLGEDLDGVPLARRLLDAEVDLGKVALAKLVEEAVLLMKGTRLPALRVSEDEAGFAVDRNLVLILKLAALIPANESLVDIGAIAG